MPQRPRAFPVAAGGVLAAAAVAVMTLGTAIPVGTFCCPVLASLPLIPVLDLCGAGVGMAWYGAVSIFALLLSPDREAALLFLLLGYYPAVRPLLERFRSRPLRLGAKLLLFNLAVTMLYGLLLRLLAPEAEMEGAAQWIGVALLILGNGTFLIYDLLLGRLTHLWQQKWRKRILKE